MKPATTVSAALDPKRRFTNSMRKRKAPSHPPVRFSSFDSRKDIVLNLKIDKKKELSLISL